MIEQTAFHSATFYRYAVVDAPKLLANLQGDLAYTTSRFSGLAAVVLAPSQLGLPLCGVASAVFL